MSSSSASSNLSHLEEDSWILWGRIVNEWEDVRKKKEKQVKVVVGRYFLGYICSISDTVLSSCWSYIFLNKYVIEASS